MIVLQALYLSLLAPYLIRHINNTGGYDSEISDDEEENSRSNSAAGDSDGGGGSSADEQETERRRDRFHRKQKEILKQVEREEKQAMGK